MGKTIEIQGKTYPMKFGYGAFRLLGDMWDCKGIQGVATKFQEEFKSAGEEVSFEQADMLGDMVLAGIECGGTIELPDRDDVVHDLLFNAEKIEEVMTAFSESFDQGKPQPRKKPGKKGK